MSTRWRRLRLTALPVAQSALAAGAAWLIATEPVGHERPFFAPIAALIALGAAGGQRLRRTGELVLGVAVGVLVGDLLVALIGTGAGQLVLVVALAMAAAVFLGGGQVIVLQAGTSAVLVTVLVAPEGSPAGLDRFVDALIGGVVGIAVTAVLPADPLAATRRDAGTVLDGLATVLTDAARAMEGGDTGVAAAALATGRRLEEDIDAFGGTLRAGAELVRIAPMYRRRRGHLAMYLDAETHIDHAVRNGRVLARRTVAMLHAHEPVPASLPPAVRTMADAVRCLRDELDRGAEMSESRRLAARAAGSTEASRAAEAGLSTQVVVAQLRSIALDLLLATGVPTEQAYLAISASGTDRGADEDAG